MHPDRSIAELSARLIAVVGVVGVLLAGGAALVGRYRTADQAFPPADQVSLIEPHAVLDTALLGDEVAAKSFQRAASQTKAGRSDRHEPRSAGAFVEPTPIATAEPLAVRASAFASIAPEASSLATSAPTATAVAATSTPVPDVPAATAVAATSTPVPDVPAATAVAATSTPVPLVPTATAVAATSTPVPLVPTATAGAATSTPVPLVPAATAVAATSTPVPDVRAATAVAATSTPVPVAPTPTVPPAPPTSSSYEKRGQYVLGQISFNWRSLGYSVSFHPPRSGFRGLTYPYENRIEIYVDPLISDSELAHVIAHEIGHAVDVVRNSGADRQEWLAARGFAASTRWWAGDGVSDFASGSGDFAECFASWQVGSPSYSRLGGSCAGTSELVARLSTG